MAKTTHVDAQDLVEKLFDGFSSKQIARWLGVSPRTIEARRARGIGWRAEDIIAATAYSAEVRARALHTLAMLEQVDNKCPP